MIDMNSNPLTTEQVADAMESFWNAAMGHAMGRQDGTATAVVGSIVEGVAAVAARLREHTEEPAHQPVPELAPDTDIAGLIERLKKRAAMEQGYADNSAAVVAAFKDELERFDARDGSHNVYAVRMAVDHKSAVRRETQMARDSAQAASTIITLQEERNTERLRAEAVEVRVQSLEVLIRQMGIRAREARPAHFGSTLDWVEAKATAALATPKSGGQR